MAKLFCLLLGLFIYHFALAQPAGRYKALPDYVKVQYAGGIGFIAVGVGYESKRGKTETDFYYGFVPEKIGSTAIHAVTGKFTWFPLKKWERQKLEIKPLSAGVLVNYTFGKQYFFLNPDNYPYNYYGYPTALHFGAFLGGQISTSLKKNVLKRIALYYELGTFDYGVVSYFTNTKSLTPGEIVHVGIGLKATL